MQVSDDEAAEKKKALLNEIQSTAVNQRHAPGLALKPFAELMIMVANETSDTISNLKKHITNLNEKN